MMISTLSTQSDTFEQLLTVHPEGKIFQSALWAKFLEGIPGIRGSFLCTVEEDGVLYGGIRSYVYGLGKRTWIYTPCAPIITEAGRPHLQKVGEIMYTNIIQEAKKRRAVWWRTECTTSVEDEPLKSVLEHWGKKTNESYQPEATLRLALSGTEEEILAQMKPKGRYNIRLAEKKGVVVKKYIWGKEGMEKTPSGEDPITLFYTLFQETTARDGFKGREEQYYRRLLEVVGEKGFLLLAFHEGEVLAGGIFSLFGHTCIYHFGASSVHKREYMAPYSIQWKAIQEARNKGMMYYDFLGISPEGVLNHPWQKVTEFKKKFGGEGVEYVGAYEVVFSPIVYSAIKLLKWVRKKRK